MPKKTLTELLATHGFGYDPDRVKYDPGHDEGSSMVVTFNGFVIDFFKTESGSLGMTVEVGEELDIDAQSVDIFVDKDLRVIVA